MNKEHKKLIHWDKYLTEEEIEQIRNSDEEPTSKSLLENEHFSSAEKDQITKRKFDEKKQFRVTKVNKKKGVKK